MRTMLKKKGIFVVTEIMQQKHMLIIFWPFILIQSKKIYTEPSQNYNNNFINIDKIDPDMKNDKEEYDNNYNDCDDVAEFFD
jgi:hypothetical protein